MDSTGTKRRSRGLLRDLDMIEIASCSEFLAGKSICQRYGCFGSCGTFSVSSPHFCFDPESERRADIALGRFVPFASVFALQTARACCPSAMRPAGCGGFRPTCPRARLAGD